jgi:alpha-aminoadipic semialdehyde synthase
VPKLRLIADITCDIEGAIECTVKATDPGEPAFVYDPQTGTIVDGIVGDGLVVLAVDTLPCELPVDASIDFSRALRPLVPALAAADFSVPLEASGLPPELQGATIVYRGKLTERYRYLEESL